jgi:hypothetical protein
MTLLKSVNHGKQEIQGLLRNDKNMMTGLMVYIHNLRTQEAEEEDHKFEASLGCRVESYLKKKKRFVGEKKGLSGCF